MGLEAARVCTIVVYGKARKICGGETKSPKEVLTAPLVPLDRPPHPLKLAEVVTRNLQPATLNHILLTIYNLDLK